jgi:RNA polymerase sigma factor (sigma-70 family)
MSKKSEKDLMSKKLMSRIQDRDREAMGELYELLKADVRKELARSLDMKSPSRLDEASHEVWVAILEKADTYKESSEPFEAWLLEVVESVCTEIKQKAWQERSLHNDVEDRARWADRPRTPPEEVDHEQLVRDVDRALAGLSPEERKVFRLRHEEGLDWVDIARAMRTSMTTVRRIFESAFTQLKSALEKYAPEESDRESGGKASGAHDPDVFLDPPDAEEPRDAA